jgi:hypothetical protein
MQVSLGKYLPDQETSLCCHSLSKRSNSPGKGEATLTSFPDPGSGKESSEACKNILLNPKDVVMLLLRSQSPCCVSPMISYFNDDKCCLI